MADDKHGNERHGASRRGRRTPEYSVWAGMRRRCETPSVKSYPDYGGRGIRVCERWNDFATFLHDMGPRPSRDHSIDRINNDGNYEPDNCRWATRCEQNRNQRPRRIASECKRGHPLSGENLYVRPNGKRACMECRRMALRRFYVRHGGMKARPRENAHAS